MSAERAVRAYTEASRGALHPMLSTDAAYADDVAHALTPISGVMAQFDTRRMHGPTQWLEPAPPASVQTHERMRLLAPVDVMPGQTGLGL